MNDELQHLRNLGKTSAQWLHAVGIHSASDLRRLGAVGAYQAVKSRGSGHRRCCCTPSRRHCWTCTGMICRSSVNKRSMNSWTPKALCKKIKIGGMGIDL